MAFISTFPNLYLKQEQEEPAVTSTSCYHSRSDRRNAELKRISGRAGPSPALSELSNSGFTACRHLPVLLLAQEHRQMLTPVNSSSATHFHCYRTLRDSKSGVVNGFSPTVWPPTLQARLKHEPWLRGRTPSPR